MNQVTENLAVWFTLVIGKDLSSSHLHSHTLISTLSLYSNSNLKTVHNSVDVKYRYLKNLKHTFVYDILNIFYMYRIICNRVLCIVLETLCGPQSIV